MEKKKVVIALGGNALGKDVEEQKEAVAKTAKVIVDLAQQGLDIIVTHGKWSTGRNDPECYGQPGCYA